MRSFDLRRSFPFTHVRYGNLCSRTQLCHPLAQRGDDNFTANNHRCRQGQPHIVMLLHQQNQRHGNHQLVGDRVEEGAEGRGLVPASGQVAVEPVGEGKDDE